MESGWAVTLEKNLPVAAGLGGGSADAGAIFRMVERSHGLPDDWQTRAAKLGADVPACVLSETCIGRGTGTDLEPVESDLAGTPVLLVNPRVPMATGPVFKAWDGTDRGALPEGSPREIALAGRNDLEAPAIALCPQIAEVLAALARHRALAGADVGIGRDLLRALRDRRSARRCGAADRGNLSPTGGRWQARCDERTKPSALSARRVSAVCWWLPITPATMCLRASISAWIQL